MVNFYDETYTFSSEEFILTVPQRADFLINLGLHFLQQFVSLAMILHVANWSLLNCSRAHAGFMFASEFVLQ